MSEKNKTDAVIILKAAKQCKGSVRYETADPTAVITNVYLDRAFANPMPDAIEVTIKPR